MQDLFAVHMKNAEIWTYDLSFNEFSCPIFLRACELLDFQKQKGYEENPI